MKQVTNEKYIKRNKNIGGALFIINLAVLGVGAYFAVTSTNNTEGIVWSWVALAIGISLTRISMYFMNRFGRSPRYDEVLAEVFGKLRHDYTFFSFSSPVPYLLLGPCRLWLPILVTSGGKISYENGKWKHSGVGLFKILIGQESLVKPEFEVADATKNIQQQLAKHGIPFEDQPTIQPVIVLLNSTTKLGNLEGAPYQAITLPELKRYIRKVDRENCPSEIAAEDNQKLIRALSEKI